MDFSKLKKLESNSNQSTQKDENKVVAVIVKVKQDNYHPNCLQLRVQISPRIFTADIKLKDLTAVENDDLVETVSLSRPLSSY
jgi:hypothetical protein